MPPPTNKPIFKFLDFLALAFSISLITSVFIYRFLNLESQNFVLKLKTQKELGKKLFIIGLLAISGALIPIILAGRYVRMFLVYDRYTITSIIGVSFLLIGISLYLIPKKFTNLFLISLIFLSLLSNLMTGFYRMDNWNKQKDLWW